MSSMRCEDIRSRLALALDEDAELDRHLAGCAECRAEAERLRRLFALMRSTAEVEPPAALDRRVVASFAPVLRPATAMFLATAGLLALYFALAILLSYVGGGSSGPLVALMLTLGYTAMSFVALLPLILRRRPWNEETTA